MRLRLFHKLFLLLAMTALLAAMAMAIVLSFNLRSGFADYLDARDDEQFSAFVDAASANIAAHGGAAALRDGRLTLLGVFEAMVRNGEVPNTPPDFRAKIMPPPPIDDEGSRPPARRPRPSPPAFFAPRLLLFEADNRQVLGPKPPVDIALLERPIRVAGQTVGSARLLPRGPTPGNVDARFLQSQYRAAGLTLALMLALASAFAYAFARAGVARLLEMQRATTAIAKGDLTARAAFKGDDELSAMGQNINHMALSLELLDTSRRRWLAEISHELRTPLSVLVGELDALKDGVRPLKMTAVHSLSEETLRLSRVVDDLHFLAMSDLSGITCQFAPCDGVDIIDRLIRRWEQTFKAANITLGSDYGGLKSLSVIWDKPRIQQLLDNILSNSLRYTDAPGAVRITVLPVATGVAITIDDSSPSVEAAHLERLFDPLFRVEGSRAHVSGGSGLGLAIAAAIACAHDGSMRAAPSALGGLLVQIILPVDARANV